MDFGSSSALGLVIVGGACSVVVVVVVGAQVIREQREIVETQNSLSFAGEVANESDNDNGSNNENGNDENK